MRRLVVRLLAFAIAFSTLAIGYAQSPIPGGVFVNGGWVPCDHPIAVAAGVGCTATAPAPPAILGGPLATFTPGHTYEMPYGHRMRVLTLSATTRGETAVTCEWVTGAGGLRPPNGDVVGSVFAFTLGEPMARKWWAAQ